MTPDERKRALDDIATEVAGCTLCPLAAQRTLAVPGEGHPDTEVVFVGEGPGFNEDRDGRPFVGAAGNLLNELLTAIGWKREEVFITNVVKCRPPGNRDPEPSEIDACAPYLKRQLEVLDPAVVVTLGRHSLQTFQPGARISATHGTHRPVDPQTGAAQAETYALYHPAAALRQYSLRDTLLADMAVLPEVLLEARVRRATSAQPLVAVAAEPVDSQAPTPAPALEPEHDPEPAPEVELAEVFAAAAIPAIEEPVDENQLPLFG